MSLETVHGLLLVVAAIAAVTVVVLAAPPGRHLSGYSSLGVILVRLGLLHGRLRRLSHREAPVAAGTVNSDPGGMLARGAPGDLGIWRTQTSGDLPRGYVAYGGGGTSSSRPVVRRPGSTRTDRARRPVLELRRTGGLGAADARSRPSACREPGSAGSRR